jgi:hypothetical protein
VKDEKAVEAKKRRRHVWIVQMKIGDMWYPTTGAAITLKAATKTVREWRERNPSDTFHVHKFWPESGRTWYGY